MRNIKVKSPTRIDFSGGTLDCWPLFAFLEGATTINLAIDIFTEVEIKENEDQNDKKIICKSADLEKEIIYSDIEDLLSDENCSLELLRSHIAYWKPEKGFTLTAKSGSPVGAGLGGSSSLSISLIKALSSFCEKEISNKIKISLAGNIEAKLLNTPTGSQDYYPPTFGGLNIIDYGLSKTTVEVLKINESELENRFFLVYTGRPHHSGLNNWGIIKSVVEKDKNVISNLQKLKVVSEEVKNVCVNKDWDKLGDLFRQEFDGRINLSPAISCPELEKLKSVAISAGAEALKICGAGGGGCAMVWCKPNKFTEVLNAVNEVSRKEGFRVLKVKPVSPL